MPEYLTANLCPYCRHKIRPQKSILSRSEKYPSIRFRIYICTGCGRKSKTAEIFVPMRENRRAKNGKVAKLPHNLKKLLEDVKNEGDH